MKEFAVATTMYPGCRSDATGCVPERPEGPAAQTAALVLRPLRCRPTRPPQETTSIKTSLSRSGSRHDRSDPRLLRHAAAQPGPDPALLMEKVEAFSVATSAIACADKGRKADQAFAA